MKLFCLTIIAAAIGIMLAGVAVAAKGKLPTDGNLQTVQNTAAVAPVKTVGRCDTVTKTKATTFKSYTTNGYLVGKATVVDTAGSGVSVKWYLDGILSWIGSSFEFTNDKKAHVTNLSYAGYSAASRSLTSCILRQ
jgi:hypothetical protein